MSNYQDETIAEALRAVQAREWVLPAIQRDFVWSPEDICRLFDSLLRGYPISSLLLWRVDAEHAERYQFYDFVLNYHEIDAPGCPRHEGLPAGQRIAVLDGQQRLTALNLGLRGTHAKRGKYQRRGKPASYPKRSLYLDLNAAPQEADDRDEDLAYRLAFWTAEDAAKPRDADARWFPISQVLGVAEDVYANWIYNTINNLGLAGHPSAFSTLNQLWQTVHQKRTISYFLEAVQDLDRVLNIFIRVNREGESLPRGARYRSPRQLGGPGI